MIIVLIILILTLGYQISSLIFHKENFYEKIFLGFLLGSGILTLVIFLLSLLGVYFDFKSNLSILLSLNALSLIISFIVKRLSFDFKLSRLKLSKLDLIVVLIVFILFFSSLVFNIYWPVRDWDALTMYDFRGKYFSINGDISSVFMIHRYYLGYPLYTSIMHGLVYVFGFNNPMFIYTMLYISFVGLLFYSLSRALGVKVALITSLCVAFIPEIFEHSMIAYTNLPYTIFILLGYLYLINYHLTNNTKFLVASGILVGLSTWVRSSDPFWIAPLFLTIYYSFKNKNTWTFIIYILIVFSFKLPWTFFVNEISKNYTITSSNNLNLLFTSGINKYLNQIFEVLPYIYNYVIKPQIVTLSMFVLSLFLINKKSKLFVFQSTFFIIINILVITGGVYLYSIIYEKWSVIGDSVSRMSMFLTPLIYIHIAGVIEGLLNKKLR